VPELYGVKVRFFKRPSYEEAIEYFMRFAKDDGMFSD